MSKIFAAALILLTAVVPVCAGPRSARNKTALDRYVYAPDPAYKYELAGTSKGQGSTTYVLDMTSQEWRKPSEVDRNRWQHWVVIVRPDEVATSTAVLLVDGGSNGRPAPREANAILSSIARSMKCVVASIRQIPNEPLSFKDESRSRTEDEIIAYTWDKFMRTGDETWPLRLPMTKAVVRAMDTVTEFCAANGNTRVDRYIVAGGSKRGWTTWTTAAVDDRVIAIAPFVIDVLNGELSLDHHYRAYGFWAPAIQDYVDMKIMDWAGTPQYKALMKIEDPYQYRDRLDMPKLIVNATGDQYFLPDSSRFYFDGLRGEKHLRYVPNAKHDLNGSDALFTLQAFCESIVSGKARPRYEWKFRKDGAIEGIAQDKPTEVRLWQATNPKARDFRLDTLGKAFTSTKVEPDAAGRYVAAVAAPQAGWSAYFLEFTFPGAGAVPLKFTSGVQIVPDTLPGPMPPRARKP
jgi:PhoPQ-activated pathogenicity-related protein